MTQSLAIWIGLLLLVGLVRLVKFLLSRPGVERDARGRDARGGVSGGDAGLARLTAAAERVLRHKQALQARAAGHAQGHAKITNSARTGSVPAKSAGSLASHQPRHAATSIPRIASPAVTRRGGLLSGREPVIQRRR